jgi:hypothetical protein
MAGDDYLKFLPLNERADERHGELMIWLKDNLPGEGWITPSEEQWFTEALRDPNGRYIWAPPPSIAYVAVEQLCESRHIYPGSSHVFLCSTLMTVRWRKELQKVSDLLFNIPVGSPIWPSTMFEPLTLSLTSPLLYDRPWIMQRDDWVAQRESHMREMLRSDREVGGSYQGSWRELSATILGRGVVTGREGAKVLGTLSATLSMSKTTSQCLRWWM